MNDKDTTLEKLKDLAEKFVKERGWGKHHSPKNLAVSIAIEAAELMEHFQWDDYRSSYNKSDLEGELADVIIYCLYFAIESKIDIAESVEKKLAKAAAKYPVKVFNKKKDEAKD